MCVSIGILVYLLVMVADGYKECVFTEKYIWEYLVRLYR
jgi:hypothetical protein